MPSIFMMYLIYFSQQQYKVGAIVTSFLYRRGNYNLEWQSRCYNVQGHIASKVMELGLEPSSSDIRTPTINYYGEHHKFTVRMVSIISLKKMLFPTVIIISLFYILFACLYSVLAKNVLAFQRTYLGGILIFIFKWC